MIFKYLYSAPQQPWAKALLVRLAPRIETRSDKEVERLDDNKARADGGRRFQREGPATEKDY